MINVIFKNVLRRRLILEEHLKKVSTTALRFDKNGSDEDERKKEIAAQKLNALLQTFVTEDFQKEEKKNVEVEIPKPRVKFLKKKAEAKQKSSLDEQIVKAAKEVAQVVEGNKKENEMELLSRLLYKNSPPLEDKKSPEGAHRLSLSELVASMKVEKEPKASEVTRASQVRSALARKTGEARQRPEGTAKHRRKTEPVNLFGSKTLGIFPSKYVGKAEDFALETWDACVKREVRLTVTHPPSNSYEEMIRWTEKGILWEFPIDNEQGMEEERETSFADHVLLEGHLEGWCPTSGPVRHFMELVCVGLSRNYWLSAKEKKDHIDWYKNFFISRREIIREVGAGDIPNLSQNQLQP